MIEIILLSMPILFTQTCPPFLLCTQAFQPVRGKYEIVLRGTLELAEVIERKCAEDRPCTEERVGILKPAE